MKLKMSKIGSSTTTIPSTKKRLASLIQMMTSSLWFQKSGRPCGGFLICLSVFECFSSSEYLRSVRHRPSPSLGIPSFADWYDSMGMQHQWHHYNHWYESKTTKYHSDSRMDALVTFIITTVGLGMLIGPLWLLKAYNDETTRLQIISGCLVVFSGLLSIVTVARPFETLAATAG